MSNSHFRFPALTTIEVFREALFFRVLFRRVSFIGLVCLSAVVCIVLEVSFGLLVKVRVAYIYLVLRLLPVAGHTEGLQIRCRVVVGKTVPDDMIDFEQLVQERIATHTAPLLPSRHLHLLGLAQLSLESVLGHKSFPKVLCERGRGGEYFGGGFYFKEEFSLYAEEDDRHYAFVKQDLPFGEREGGGLQQDRELDKAKAMGLYHFTCFGCYGLCQEREKAPYIGSLTGNAWQQKYEHR